MINKSNLQKKYPLYFSLAYSIEITQVKFIKVSEYPSNDILHIIIDNNKTYLDAMGQYSDLKDSILHFDDIEPSNLIFETITYDEIVRYILTNQFIFDDELFIRIRNYVKNHYKERK